MRPPHLFSGADGGDADGGSASHWSQVFLHCFFSSSEYFFLHFDFLQVKSVASSVHVSSGGGESGGGAGGGSASHRLQVFLHCCFSSSEYFFLHFPFLQVKSFASSAHGGGRLTRRRAPAVRVYSEGEGEVRVIA